MVRLLQFGWLLRRRLIGLLRLRTRGVKVLLFNGNGELLLIRNRYGDEAAFVLPGGGVKRGEEPLAAARRELREEAGIEAPLRRLGVYESTTEGKRDTIHLFTGKSDAQPKADELEVAEAAFFPLDALPPSTSPATLRRVREWLGGGLYEGSW